MKIVAVLLTAVCALNFGFAGPSEAKQVTASSPPSDIREVIDYVDSLPSPNAEQLVMKAKAFYWLKDYSSAITAISKSIELKPIPKSYLFRASYSRHLGRFDDGLRDCNKAEQLGYRGSDLYELRGLIHLSLGNSLPALKDGERAVQVSESSASGFFVKGAAECQLGKLEESVSSLSKSIQISSRDPSVFELRGGVYRKLGREEEARADIQKAEDMKRQ
ncbi:tetratricopeptide repeat protein [Candidatus Obscuribacterales bacterium]|nr:tetratricopeptide repeat protein [Candidatus Obscuribacterales bacterium]